jgi:hypothetical protein
MAFVQLDVANEAEAKAAVEEELMQPLSGLGTSDGRRPRVATQNCGASQTWVRVCRFVYPERVESNSGTPHHRAMPQSLAKILVHTVFSTKERRPFLRDKALREELHRYLGGILSNLDCQPIIAGGGMIMCIFFVPCRALARLRRW